MHCKLRRAGTWSALQHRHQSFMLMKDEFDAFDMVHLDSEEKKKNKIKLH